jgi:hypothetical protein
MSTEEETPEIDFNDLEEVLYEGGDTTLPDDFADEFMDAVLSDI